MRWFLFVIFIVVQECSAICNDNGCLQKCCADNLYVLDRKKCVPYNQDLHFSELSVYDQTSSVIGPAKDHFKIETDAFSDSEFKDSVLKLQNYAVFLMQNGTIRLQEKISTDQIFRKPGQYCLDYNVSNKTGNFTHREDITAWVVLSNKKEDAKDIPLLFKCGMLVSCFFLILVLVVYTLLPELRNLGGLILMAYVASLLFAFLFLFIMQVGATNFNVSLCLGITLLIYYFLIATFCWMNVMSYDIWWTFRGYAKARQVNRRGERFKFAMYCLYAWGVPLALTIMVWLLNDRSPSQNSSGMIRPRIPGDGCFIDGNAKLAYLYGPMSIMIVLNWVLFIMTAFNIWRLSRGTQMLNSGDSSATGTAAAHHTHKQRLMVYLKLSVLMGLSWILEVVSSLHTEFQQVWYLSDLYNILMGVVIFILFVCKRKVYYMLRKRYIDGPTSASFKSRSRSTTDTNPAQTPLKTQDPSSIFRP